MPFLDAMLHLPILQTESLLLPTRIQAVAIDPELHEKHLRTFEDETQGLFKFKPRHEKTGFFAYAITKAQLSCAVNRFETLLSLL